MTHSSPESIFRDRISQFFLVLLLATAGFFFSWGIGYIDQGQFLLFSLATLFGLFMAFNIGGNDVANSFGTSVGAGTLTIKQALLVAAVFEVSGALIAGGAVTDTIRKGIVDLQALTAGPDFDAMDFVYIMMGALLAAAIWLLLATRAGWPVSTTHSIIGGIVGASVTLGAISMGSDGALELVKWGKIGQIVASWVLSPVLGGLMAYALFWVIKHSILHYNDEVSVKLDGLRDEALAVHAHHKHGYETLGDLQRSSYSSIQTDEGRLPEGELDLSDIDMDSDYYRDLLAIERRRDSLRAYKALEHYVPILAALGSLVLTSLLLYKGLKSVNLGLSDLQNMLIMAVVAVAAWSAVKVFAGRLKGRSLDESTFVLFSWMQVFTAAGFAFSHGANDIANAIGPFAAVLDVLHSGEINAKAPVPGVAMLSFGIALVAGLWFIGREVINTIGSGLTRMHPSSGFAAELSAAGVVMLASTLGIPVSSTHILVGAVLGIGVVNHSANWRLMKPIGMAWVITLPAAAALASLFFVILRTIF